MGQNLCHFLGGHSYFDGILQRFFFFFNFEFFYRQLKDMVVARGLVNFKLIIKINGKSLYVPLVTFEKTIIFFFFII
jgi:hypothetical protein